MFYYVIAMLFLVGLGMGWIGWKGIRTRKPFAISGCWLWLLMALTFSPTIFDDLALLIQKNFAGETLLVLLIPAVVVAVVLAFFWHATGGLIFFGVSADSLSDCMHKALDDSGLEYEESIAKVRLKSEDADLLVGVQDWIGTAQLRITPASKREKLLEIGAKMGEIFSRSDYPMKLLICYVYLGLAVLEMLLACGLGYLVWVM